MKDCGIVWVDGRWKTCHFSMFSRPLALLLLILLHRATPLALKMLKMTRLSSSVYPNDPTILHQYEFSIIGVPSTALPVLHERRSTATKREFEKSLEDESNPNNVFVKSAPKNQYNLRSRRSTFIEMSGTDRHQRSFIPRAHKLCGI